MRVLLADDQVWLRSALRLLLEHEANIEVVGEAAGVQVIPALIHDLYPDPLFLDWQLPGLETRKARQRLLSTVRTLQPHLYIIALINDDNANGHHLSLDADAYVSKAESPECLLAALRQATARYEHWVRPYAHGLAPESHTTS